MTCPHCMNTLGREYPQLGGNYEVVHHSQLLATLLREGRLKPLTPVDETVTYHDPCYLGRHNKVYVPPRELVAVRARRAAWSRWSASGDKSFCCGAGGAQMWMEERIGDARQPEPQPTRRIGTGAAKVAVACPFCSVMLNDGVTVRAQEAGKDAKPLEVIDVASLLLGSVRTPANS